MSSEKSSMLLLEAITMVSVIFLPAMYAAAQPVSGLYQGESVCKNGSVRMTLMNLTLFPDNSLTAKLVLSKSSAPGASPVAVAELKGHYSSTAESIDLVPTKWIVNAPAAYSMSEMKGTYDPNLQQIRGSVSGACTSFTVTNPARPLGTSYPSAVASAPSAPPTHTQVAPAVAQATPTTKPVPTVYYFYCMQDYGSSTLMKFTNVFSTNVGDAHIVRNNFQQYVLKTTGQRVTAACVGGATEEEAESRRKGQINKFKQYNPKLQVEDITYHPQE